MRFFAVILLTVAVASADPTRTSIIGQILDTIAGLKPISVGPAIVDTEPISVGPAVIESVYEPIAVGPAIVDFPLPDGGAVAESVVAPSPVAIIPGPVADVSASAPLVQIVVNINQAAESSPIGVAPIDVIAPEIKPEPVQVVEIAPEPVQVVEVAPEPVQVVEIAPVPSPISPPIAVNPIGVVNPVEVEPIQIGVPVIPEAAVVLPEELN